MRSSFFEFNVALTGLYTARTGLDVTGHNISNGATIGYSRQYAEIKANSPLSFNNGRGMIGTGSYTFGIGQYRDFHLDVKYWGESSVLGEYETKSTNLGLMETIFNASKETGLTGAINNFFDTLQGLAESSGDDTYRINSLKNAESLAKLINNTARDLKRQQIDINTEVKTTVNIINSLGSQITSLNEQIRKFEGDGSRANDLRDQRALLVDELSKYVNVEVREVERNKDYEAGKYPDPEDRGKSEKEFFVSINGYDFVKSDTLNPLRVQARTDEEKRNVTDADGLYDIYFENTNQKFDIYNSSLKGELKGLIDVRDGNNGNNTLTGKNAFGEDVPLSTVSYKGIPHYLNKLNELVRVFAKAMNEGETIKYNKDGTIEYESIDVPEVSGHAKGYDATGSGIPSGRLLFSNGEINELSNGDYDKDYMWLTAENFQINPDILADPKLMACAKSPNADESDNEIILELIHIKNYRGLFKEGKLEDYVIGTASELGIDVKQANSFKKNYIEVTTTVNNQRKAVSGVDENEELVNYMRYQQMYKASSKLMTVINEIYDNLINRMGV